MEKLLLRNAKIVDGTGSPWFWGNVLIQGDRITHVLDVTSFPKDRKYKKGKDGDDDLIRNCYVIDLDGKMLAPGFIDIHSHSDDTILINPLAESKIRQGITTEVIGNCGYSLAPLVGFAKDSVERDLLAYKIAPCWLTFKEYLQYILNNGTAVNIAALVGHGTIRQAVIGPWQRKPSLKELAYMKDLLSQAMDEGAFGMSTGLVYPPSCYGDTDEIVELARIVAEKGGIYATHIRCESDEVINAVKEAILIGRKTGVKVQISHHKTGKKRNWGKVRETIKIMENARLKGVDVTCDVYPYIASSTGLSSLLPNWVFSGGNEETISRLKEKATLNKIRKEIDERENLDVGWDKTIIASVTKSHNKKFEGKSLLEISKTTGKHPFDTLIALLIDEALSVQVVRFIMCEDDVMYVLGSGLSCICTDASARAPYGILGIGKPHPRAYGTFPRVISRYAQDMGIFRIEEAIRKMTSMAASRLGILDRGIIRPGMIADLVVFDPDTIEDTATYTNPHRYPNGVIWVFVNGKPVIKQHEHTGLLYGKVLKGNSL